MVLMDDLLGSLRQEMIDLRASSCGLAKQMWLLYVTFEDFVCTHHPSRSQELIASSIDIDSYLKPKSLHWTSRNPIQCPISNTTDQETLSENQDEVSSIGLSERKRLRSEAEENSIQPGLFVQTDKEYGFCFVDNVIVSYRFAKKLHISSLYSHKNNVFRTIGAPNGVKHTVTMALSRPDRRARSADKMRDYNAQTTKQKLRDFKSSHCTARDKPGYSQEFSASFGNHQRDARVKDCVSRVKHTGKHTLDNSRYNPDLPGTIRCAKKDAMLRSNCTGPEERLSATKTNQRGQRKTHQPQKRTDNRNETQEKESSLINRINDLCWANESIESTTPGHTEAPVNIPPQRPTVLFSEKDRSLGDLKRSNDLVSPQSDTTITPDSSRCPKRHCLIPPYQDDPALLSPDSGLDRTRSLSESFDQVMSAGSQFDDPVQNTNDGTARAHSSDSSPVTISSGYESDSLPTCEADIDKIFVKRNKHKTKSSTTEPTTDYFSFSETYPPNLNASVSDMGYKPQQPPKVIVTRVPEKVLPHSSNAANTRLIDNDNTISIPDKSSVRNIRATEGNFQCQLPLKPRRQIIQETSDRRFSPAQRNNYQLTKVARSMFQIIHDLQIEKEATDKRKSRKVRRAPAFKGEVSPAVQTDKAEGQQTQEAPAVADSQADGQNIVQSDEQQICERKVSVENLTQESENEDIKSAVVVPGNNVAEPSQSPATPSLPPQPGKFIIKCVRRPLGSNPADFARDLPHSSSAVNYLQDENTPDSNSAIPNLLPDTSSRVQMLSPRVHNWSNNTSTPQSNRRNIHEPERIPFTVNGCSPYATTRLPGCCTPKRDDRMDDHVYETIPGDEYLYAEFLRLRELGLLPKRLNRIPDHPGHFIPFDPPALPKRNPDNSPKERPISARERSKRPPVPPFSQSRCVRQPLTDSPRPHAMMRSFSWEGHNAFDPDMSTHSVPDKYMTNPGRRSDAGISQNWAPGDEFNYVEGVRQPPPKRRENFYLLLQNKQKRAEISQSLEIETKLKELGLVFDERFKGRHTTDSDGYTKIDDDLLPLEHPRDRGQVFLKSTFV